MKYNNEVLRRKQIALEVASNLVVASLHSKTKKKLELVDESKKIYNWLLKTTN